MKDFTDKIPNVLKLYGHIYALILIIFTAVYVRIQGVENLITDSGATALLGNDSWYHYRAVRYTIENYPFTIGVDPKSGFPVGADVGTFGTLYDQIIATIALVIGLGNPTEELIIDILVYSTPIFFIGVILAVYSLTNYLTESKWMSVLAAGLVSVIPGTLFERTVVGFAQHHVLEVFFILVSIYFIIKSLNIAESEYISIDVIKSKEFESLKPWFTSTIIASFALMLYYLTWPPAMMMFGLIAISATLYTLINYQSKKLIEPALLTYTVILTISLLTVLTQRPVLEFSVSQPSILHVGVAGLSLLGVGLLLVLNRYAEEKNWSMKSFYAATIGTGLISFIIISVIQPVIILDIFDNILRLLGYPFGIGGGEDIQTIAEEQSTTVIDLTFSQYGLLLITSIGGMIYTFIGKTESITKNKNYASNIFIATVAIFMFVISLRTIRFNYYLAAFVAIFASVMIQQLIQFVDIPKNTSEIEGYQVIAVILLITLIIPIVFFPLGGTVFAADRVNVQDYNDWEEPLIWLDESTESDNIPNDISTSERPYNYSEDAYGVMSWWDYGHWITVTGDKSPVSNPFQQHAAESSEYLLADSPEKAEQVFEDNEIRYVMIDWQMASPYSKLGAIPEFNENVSTNDLVTPYYQIQGTGYDISFFERNQQYYETMLARLYVGHGSQMSPGPYTVDYSIEETQTNQAIQTVLPQSNPIKVHNSTEEAQQYADENEGVTFGGFGTNPPEDVEALEQYRLVKSSPTSALQREGYGFEASNILSLTNEEIEITEINENPSTVKVFEHVEGAELEVNNVDSDETITATVTLFDETTGLEFDYVQESTADESGTATLTVPYSTTGYEYIDTYEIQVTALSSYEITRENDTDSTMVDIHENDVMGEESDVTQVQF